MSLKTYAVIVAGGSGSRMGNETPKQYLDLLGKPVLRHTLEAFTHSLDEAWIVLVVHPSHLQQARSASAFVSLPHRVNIVEGGNTRFLSVKAGLDQIEEPDAIVFIHDAVRCLVTPALIQTCLESTLKNGNAVPAVTSVESTRLLTAEGNRSIDRDAVKLVQTPQTFRAGVIRSAYAAAAHDHFSDDATVLESTGAAIHLVEGERSNIKLTWPVDMLFAEQLLSMIKRHA
jgi:2-C-methyl-D-erythritol 4-phosphate cytidylyltransferase